MGGRTFDCLEAVINRYRTEQIVEGHTLGHPVKRVRNVFFLQKASETKYKDFCMFM